MHGENSIVLSEHKNVFGKAKQTIMENEKIIDRWKEQIRKGEKEGWILAEDGFDEECLNKYEAIFCQGNGYLGVRGALEERYTGEVRNLFVAGTFDRFAKAR